MILGGKVGGACDGIGGTGSVGGRVGNIVGTTCVVGTLGRGVSGNEGGIMDGGKGRNLGGTTLGGVT